MSAPTNFDIAHSVTTIARGLLLPSSPDEYAAALDAAMSASYDVGRNVVHALVQLAEKPSASATERFEAVVASMTNLAAKQIDDELPRWGFE